MLRHILLATLIAFSGLTAHAVTSSYLQDEEQIMPAGDRWTPFPWNFKNAQPFPWSDIQGTWKVEQDSFISYFSFKVIQQKNGVRQLKVKQYDGESCRLLATGVGIEKGQLVYAQMTSKSGKIYRVSLTAFKRSDSPQPPLQGNVYTESVMVLSIGELNQVSVEDMMHTQILKVSSQLDQKSCVDDLKN
ncbi:hypothetical protein [Bdellovibrio svalbardensis]|uniref:Uncharacterized protein n=1 Tax=Bdellovibrio svalbardensis TaxID=2972972 RepID=A0ABT6DFT1_9BACT|nr:hypothetical protein [Bdellovibrio svalbardensis]MDG0815105.1 hypothetical protein [Bdellovibrio svalbardensis]